MTDSGFIHVSTNDPISFILVAIILLHTCTYYQGRNRDTDIENGWVGIAGEGEREMNWEIRFEINTLPCVK